MKQNYQTNSNYRSPTMAEAIKWLLYPFIFFTDWVIPIRWWVKTFVLFQLFVMQTGWKKIIFVYFVVFSFDFVIFFSHGLSNFNLNHKNTVCHAQNKKKQIPCWFLMRKRNHWRALILMCIIFIRHLKMRVKW